MRLRVRDPRLLVVVSAALLGAAVAFPLGVIATHQFTDVPTTSTFHADIDAIRDAGVTTGCAAGKYCPKDFVTREQMAAFLNRLGALQAGKTPVVNADKVDGRDASDMIYVIDDEKVAYVSIQNDMSANFEQVTIEAPSDGFVLVTASVSINNDGCSSECWVYGAIELSTIPLVDTDIQHQVSLPSLYATVSMTITRVIPVEAGSNTVQVRLKRFASSGQILHSSGQISAIFTPFGESPS